MPESPGPRRREVLLGLGGAALAAVLAACGADQRPAPSSATPSRTPSATPSASPAPEPTPTPTVADVDVEVMVGQMILLGFRGTTLTPDAPVVADLRDRHIGSLLIAAHDVPSGRPLRNIASPAQLAALSAAVQETAGRPVLLATDEEGGAVARLGPEFGFPATRSAADLGAAGDVDATRAAGAAIARTLRDAGIRLNLAPVVDVDTNPSNPVIGALGRSYSADPAVVAAQAGAFVAGHRDTGVLTCLKHFPGHGSSTSDSHAGFVDVSSTWQPLELDPYRSLIGAGLADAVMAAHVFNDRIDPTYPASLSSATITDLLRGELGFGGVVISDDLQMGAITQGWGLTDAIRLSVLAGTDILTFSNNLDTYDPDLGRTVHTTLLDLVRSGVVSEDRIAESYARITALTARVA